MLKGRSEFLRITLTIRQCDASDRAILRALREKGGGIPDCLLIALRKKLTTQSASLRRLIDEEA